MTAELPAELSRRRHGHVVAGLWVKPCDARATQGLPCSHSPSCSSCRAKLLRYADRVDRKPVHAACSQRLSGTSAIWRVAGRHALSSRMTDVACSNALTCLYAYQTILAGVLAIIAAGIGAWAVIRSGAAPIAEAAKSQALEETWRRKFFGSVLAQDLSALRSRCRQAEGVIRVLHGGNHPVDDRSRSQMHLRLHPLIEDWEFMSLLPDSLLKRLIELDRAIADHNYDIDRAGTFTVDAWRESIVTRLERISGEANALRGLAMLVSRDEALPANASEAPAIADG
jgi:hypothetical protein